MAKFGGINLSSSEEVLHKTEDSDSTSESGALELRNLSVGYADALISEINVSIVQGETIAILGSSGEVIHDFPKRSGIGYIPQRLGLIRHSSVRSNVAIGARTRKPKWYPALFPLGSELNSDIDSALAELSIGEYAKTPVRILSGGQQRRVAIARALVQKPKLILADEFLGELDKENVDSIIQATKKLISETGSTLIMVEHHESRAYQIADRILRIKDGKIVEEVSQ